MNGLLFFMLGTCILGGGPLCAGEAGGGGPTQKDSGVENAVPKSALLITKVTPGGLARMAGLQAGDLVYTLGGEPLVHPETSEDRFLDLLIYLEKKDPWFLKGRPAPKPEADGSFLLLFRRGMKGSLQTARLATVKGDINARVVVFREVFGEEAWRVFVAEANRDFPKVAADIEAAVRSVGKSHWQFLHVYAQYLAQSGKMENAKQALALAADLQFDAIRGCGRGMMVQWGRWLSEGESLVSDRKASRELGGFIIERHISMFPDDAHIPAFYAEYLAYNWRDGRGAVDVARRFLSRGTEGHDRKTIVRAFMALAEGYKLLGDFGQEADARQRVTLLRGSLKDHDDHAMALLKAGRLEDLGKVVDLVFRSPQTLQQDQKLAQHMRILRLSLAVVTDERKTIEASQPWIAKFGKSDWAAFYLCLHTLDAKPEQLLAYLQGFDTGEPLSRLYFQLALCASRCAHRGPEEARNGLRQALAGLPEDWKAGNQRDMQRYAELSKTARHILNGGDDGDFVTRLSAADIRSEAAYYIGAMRFAEGKEGEANLLFERVLKEAPADYYERVWVKTLTRPVGHALASAAENARVGGRLDQALATVEKGLGDLETLAPVRRDGRCGRLGRALLLRMKAKVLNMQRREGEEWRILCQALRLAGQVLDANETAQGLLQAGFFMGTRKRFSEADFLFSQALQHAEARGEMETTEYVLIQWTAFLEERGEWQRSWGVLREFLDRHPGYSPGLALRFPIVRAALRLGDIQSAWDWSAVPNQEMLVNQAMGFHQAAWEHFLTRFERDREIDPFGAADCGVNALRAAVAGKLFEDLDRSKMLDRMERHVTESTLAVWFKDDVLEQRARLLLARKKDKQDLDEALEVIRKLEAISVDNGWVARLWTVRYLKVNALRMSGRMAEARRLSGELLDESEAARDAHSELALRGSLGADERDAVFDAVGDAVGEEREDRAFELSERFRNRLLGDLLIGAGYGRQEPSEQARAEYSAAKQAFEVALREFEGLLQSERLASLEPSAPIFATCGQANRRLEVAKVRLAVERYRPPQKLPAKAGPAHGPAMGSAAVRSAASAAGSDSVSNFNSAEACALSERLQSVFLCYYLGSKSSYAFVISPKSVKAIPLSITESEAALGVYLLRLAIEDPDPEKYRQLAALLYERLWKPVSPMVKGVARIGIVPHGALHALPFSLLDDGQEPLCEKHALFFAPSLRSLAQIVALKEREQKKGYRLVALGNPHHPEGGAGFLKAAERECETLAKGFFAATVLLGPNATEAVVKKLPEDAGFLHLSCHGMLAKKGPFDSALLLSRTGLADPEDGYLTAAEILGLDLKRLRFMALSACVTGLGKRSSGDDVLGLTCACFVAGVPTTAASLWPVEDEQTSLLFQELYRGVAPQWIDLEKKPGYDEAMRRAQLARRKVVAHPRAWAGFQIYGDPRR